MQIKSGLGRGGAGWGEMLSGAAGLYYSFGLVPCWLISVFSSSKSCETSLSSFFLKNFCCFTNKVWYEIFQFFSSSGVLLYRWYE